MGTGSYTGDYTYNGAMGSISISSTGVASFGSNQSPYEKVSQVPGNVLLATDTIKAYCWANGGQQWRQETFGNITYLTGQHFAGGWNAPAGQIPDMWFPHTKSTQANCLFMDGHVALVLPDDFLIEPNGGDININLAKSTTTPPMWTYTNATGMSSPNFKGWLCGYYKYGANPVWQTPWDKTKPSLY